MQQLLKETLEAASAASAMLPRETHGATPGAPGALGAPDAFDGSNHLDDDTNRHIKELKSKIHYLRKGKQQDTCAPSVDEVEEFSGKNQGRGYIQPRGGYSKL